MTAEAGSEHLPDSGHLGQPDAGTCTPLGTGISVADRAALLSADTTSFASTDASCRPEPGSDESAGVQQSHTSGFAI